MKSPTLTYINSNIDNDRIFKANRVTLTVISLIFIVLNIFGVSFEKANVVIFNFTPFITLEIFLSALIGLLTLCYYKQARTYHNELFQLWSGKMLKDDSVYTYNLGEEKVNGLLAKVIDVDPIDEPGIKSVKYQISGLFQRTLAYPSRCYDEIRGDFYCDKYIKLNEFSENWTLGDYFQLLKLEARYQCWAFINYKEHIDLIFPIIISAIAISTFIYR